MIREFARDDLRALRLPLQLPVRADQFQRSLICLAAAVAEHRVIEPPRRECGKFCGEFNGGFGRGVEKRWVVAEPLHLPGRGVNEFAAPVADIHAPQPGETIEESAAILILHVHAAPAADDVRALRVQFLVIRERVQVVFRVELLERCQRAHGRIYITGASRATDERTAAISLLKLGVKSSMLDVTARAVEPAVSEIPFAARAHVCLRLNF